MSKKGRSLMLDSFWLVVAVFGIASSSPPWVALALNGRLAELGQERLIHRAIRDLELYDAALHRFKFDCERYPTSEEGLAALIHEPAFRKGWKGPYVKAIVTDPWGRPYMYRRPGVHNPGGFDLASLGPDGIESNDDIGNW